MQHDDMLDYGQAQAGSPEMAGARPVHHVEPLAEPGDISLGNALPRVRNFEESLPFIL